MTKAQNLELQTSLPALAEEQIRQYRQDGHLIVPQVLSSAEVEVYRHRLLVVGRREHQKLNDYERSVGASGNQFIFDLREIDPMAWQFIAEPKIAKVAAELLKSDRVRILHYNCFFKPSQGRGTPWHRDCLFIPLEADKLITAWVPLVDLSPEMGLLTFVSGSNHPKGWDFSPTNQYSGDSLEPMLSKRGLRLSTVGKMKVGDVSFHSSLTLHGAPVNESNCLRAVVAISYYADEARIQDPELCKFFPSQTVRSIAYRQHFLREYFSDLKPGDFARNRNHPVVYERL